MPMIEEDEAAPGAPAWMATFADLMSLLMCFCTAFVLLRDGPAEVQTGGRLDEERLRRAEPGQGDGHSQGHQHYCPGVQPGRPQPTQVDTVNQFTTETTKPSLQVGNPTALTADGKEVDSEQFKQLVEEK